MKKYLLVLLLAFPNLSYADFVIYFEVKGYEPWVESFTKVFQRKENCDNYAKNKKRQNVKKEPMASWCIVFKTNKKTT